PGLYRIGALEPDVGANQTLNEPVTLQLGAGINVIRYLRHIDGTTLVMPDMGPPYPTSLFLDPTFTFTGPLSTNPVTPLPLTRSPCSWGGGGSAYSTTNVSASRIFNLGAYTDSVHFGTGDYNLDLVGPNMTLVHVGYYPGATRWPFQGSGPGLNFDSPGF